MGRVVACILVGLWAVIACGAPRASMVPTVGPSSSADGLVTSPTPVGAPGLRYVALGDSYTIGTSIRIEERWPNQLVRVLGPAQPTLDLVANLGVNGYTARDVIEVELPQLDALGPEFVTLLIGVNDVVQGVPEDTYRRSVGSILDDLMARVGPDRILIVTIPDYTVTPAGADYGNPTQQAAGIRTNNEIISALAGARGIAVIDIYDISVRAATDRSLVAPDGLHPSSEQYTLWVERIGPAVRALLDLPGSSSKP